MKRRSLLKAAMLGLAGISVPLMARLQSDPLGTRGYIAGPTWHHRGYFLNENWMAEIEPKSECEHVWEVCWLTGVGLRCDNCDIHEDDIDEA